MVKRQGIHAREEVRREREMTRAALSCLILRFSAAAAGAAVAVLVAAAAAADDDESRSREDAAD